MASNKKEVAKFYLPKKDAEFAPYEYREEEGNFKSGEYYPLKLFFIDRFLLGVYEYLPQGLFEVNFDHSSKSKEARSVVTDAALPPFPSEKEIGWSSRDLMVPLPMVQVLVPNKEVTLPPQHGATVLFSVPVASTSKLRKLAPKPVAPVPEPSSSTATDLSDTLSTFLSTEAGQELGSLLTDIEQFEMGQGGGLEFMDPVTTVEIAPAPTLYCMPRELLTSDTPLNVTKDKKYRLYAGKERGRAATEATAAAVRAKGYLALKNLAEEDINGENLREAMLKVVGDTEAKLQDIM